MAGITATVTSKGQITIPAQVRREMGLKEGDRVLFVVEADKVYMHRLPGQVRSSELYGILQDSHSEPVDVQRALDEAKDKLAAEDRASRDQPRDGLHG